MINPDAWRWIAAFFIAQIVHIGVFGAVSTASGPQVLIAGQSISVRLQTGVNAAMDLAPANTGHPGQTAPEAKSKRTPEREQPAPEEIVARREKAELIQHDAAPRPNEAEPEAVPQPPAPERQPHATKKQASPYKKPETNKLRDSKQPKRKERAAEKDAPPTADHVLPGKSVQNNRNDQSVDTTETPEETGNAASAATAITAGNAAQEAKTATTQGNAKNSNYAGLVMKHLSRFRRPRAPAQGAAMVTFAIALSGKIAHIEISRGSGSYKFDRDAIKFIERAAPFPVPPAGVSNTFTVEIEGR
ncbi:TonB family protein [Kordiimonas sp.]|uniref:TonB family protein n=1 Tax=Kordiimonas sp. TaxID=1970157 RepID=UPI003A90807B